MGTGRREILLGLLLVAAAATAGGWPGAAPAPVATDIGDAAVDVGRDTARVVQRVEYEQPVTRVGDVLLVDGRPAGSVDDARVAEAWRLVEETVPRAWRRELVQLSVVEQGPLELVGVVHQTRSHQWVLSLDAVDLATPDVVVETIVHELAHMVTLRADEFVFGTTQGCDGVEVDIGCADADSVLGRFASRFWPGGLRTEGFVNDYARSAVHEDLAETFTAWVFAWDALDDQVVAEKVELLATDPVLARLWSDLGGPERAADQPAAASSPASASMTAATSDSGPPMSRGVSPPSNSTPVSR